MRIQVRRDRTRVRLREATVAGEITPQSGARPAVGQATALVAVAALAVTTSTGAMARLPLSPSLSSLAMRGSRWGGGMVRCMCTPPNVAKSC